MAIYQRGNNWYIDFRFKGKRVRESIGPSRKSAEKIIAKKKAEIAENKYLDIRKDPEPITFHAFCVLYRPWAKTNKKVSTNIRELEAMRVFNKVFGDKYVRDITPQIIEQWKSKRAEKCAPNTVNRELIILQSIFRKATEWGGANKVPYLTENPVKKVKRLEGGTERERYLLRDQVMGFLNNMAPWFRPVALVSVFSGMRKGEVLDLEWPRVNFDQNVITLINTKNGKRHDVIMNETVRATLLAQGPKKEGLVFPSPRSGTRITDRSFYGAFHRALEKSGILDFKFHDLRHTVGSNLAMAGIDLSTIAEVLGQKDVKMAKRYSHLSPMYKARVVNLLDVIFGAKEKEPMSQNPPQEQVVYS